MMDGVQLQARMPSIRAGNDEENAAGSNGSRAPFGYQVVPVDVPVEKGKVRKQLAVDDLEAPVVRQIFDLYRHGLAGKPMGMKAIATHLNAAGTLMRGRPWRIQKLHDLLGDPS